MNTVYIFVDIVNGITHAFYHKQQLKEYLNNSMYYKNIEWDTQSMDFLHNDVDIKVNLSYNYYDKHGNYFITRKTIE